MISERMEVIAAEQKRIECPIWHSPLMFIVPGGIECRCHSCRKGAAHFISRGELEHIWDEMAVSGASHLQLVVGD